MNDYYDEKKLIIPNGKLIMKVNCEYCLPCGICKFKSTFDKQVLCNEFERITLKLDQKKTCMNCLNKGIAKKDFPCNECEECSKWRAQYNE